MQNIPDAWRSFCAREGIGQATEVYGIHLIRQAEQAVERRAEAWMARLTREDPTLALALATAMKRMGVG